MKFTDQNENNNNDKKTSLVSSHIILHCYKSKGSSCLSPILSEWFWGTWKQPSWAADTEVMDGGCCEMHPWPCPYLPSCCWLSVLCWAPSGSQPSASVIQYISLCPHSGLQHSGPLLVVLSACSFKFLWAKPRLGLKSTRVGNLIILFCVEPS